MMYIGESFPAQTLRKCASVNLAWWHTYKHVSGAIWKAFANLIFAPLWHDLYPDSKFYVKAQSPLDHVVHFCHLMASYPSVQQDLLDARNKATGTHANVIENVLFLFEYALPSVM